MSAISVVVPVFNRAATIGRALDSVLAQTCPPREIIVVDDGSTDGTPGYVARLYPQVRLIRHAENRGIGAARNTGIAQAAGDLIALLDSDDAWLPRKLEIQSACLAAHPALALLGTRKIENPPRLPAIGGTARLKVFPFPAFLKRTRLHPSSVVIRKSVFAEVGNFDESLRAAEDRDMWARIAYRYPVARVEKILTLVFKSAESVSWDRLRQYCSDIEVFAKWNPADRISCDTEGRLTPPAYQRYLLSFFIARAFRLRRHVGREAVREFGVALLEKLDPAPATRMAIRMALRCLG